MRLIDADALLEELKKTGRYFQAKFDIENAPTVEPYCYFCGQKEHGIRKQGEWIFLKANEEQTDGYECSVCKATFHTKVPYFSEFNFCPNCGADMRGET